jgi:hypothetical protein
MKKYLYHKFIAILLWLHDHVYLPEWIYKKTSPFYITPFPEPPKRGTEDFGKMADAFLGGIEEWQDRCQIANDYVEKEKK